MQSTPSTYTYRDPRHVGVISNGTSCCFGVGGFDRPWLTFKWEEANGSQHEDCQPFCSPPSRQTLDCYLLFLDPQITSPAPVQWAGLQAAVAIYSLTGWLENKQFEKKDNLNIFLANICFHTQLHGKSFTKQRATNSCLP